MQQSNGVNHLPSVAHRSNWSSGSMYLDVFSSCVFLAISEWHRTWKVVVMEACHRNRHGWRSYILSSRSGCFFVDCVGLAILDL